MESQQVLNFWFGKPEDPDYGKPRKSWFVKSDEFDRQIKSQFQGLYQQAAANELATWREKPLSCLALIILLDQFPRNMFRNSPQAFATDVQAKTYAQEALKEKFDTQLLPIQRWFMYLPFEHSENLVDQEISIKLFASLQSHLNSQNSIEYAYRHRDIIQRFGRFPHRNQILGRQSTPAELEFLQQPGSGF